MAEERFQLFVKGIQGKTTVLDIPRNCTIDALFQQVSTLQKVTTQELRLVYAGTELECGKGKTVQDYDIPNQGNLFMVIRLKGGLRLGIVLPQTPLPTWLLNKPRQTANPTWEPDMITFEDDFSSLRYKMPCGHCIGSESLKDYCKSLLEAGEYRFICPSYNVSTKCTAEWQYSLVRQVGQLSSELRQFFDIKISENYFIATPGYQKCPDCLVWSYRDPQAAAVDNTNRVVCPVSRDGLFRQYQYCWSCLKAWTAGESAGFCGYRDCQTGVDPRIAFLANQPLKTIDSVSGVPSVRGCPKCGIIVEHTAACKHMNCKSCQFNFCFVCLKPQSSPGQWQCGGPRDPCQVAPRQTTLPTGC